MKNFWLVVLFAAILVAGCAGNQNAPAGTQSQAGNPQNNSQPALQNNTPPNNPDGPLEQTDHMAIGLCVKEKPRGIVVDTSFWAPAGDGRSFNEIEYHGIPIKMNVEFWTRKSVQDQLDTPNTKFYSGSFAVNDSESGSILTSRNHIVIPYGSVNFNPPGTDQGFLIVNATLPSGRTFGASQELYFMLPSNGGPGCIEEEGK